MPAEFSSLNEALEHYWDLMLTDPAETLVGVEALAQATPETHERYPHILFYRACSLLYLGDLDAALESFDDLLESAEQRDDLQQQRRVQNSRGMVLKSMGRFADAAQALQKSAELCQQTQSLEQEIPVRLNLSNLFLELNDVQAAQWQLSAIFNLPLSEMSDEWSGELEFLKARLSIAQYDFTRVNDSIKNALSVADKLGYNHLRVNSLTILGRLQRLQGDLDAAVETLKKVLSDPDFEFEGVLGVTAYIELIKALLSESRYIESEAFIEKAQQVLERQFNAGYQYQLNELNAFCAAHRGNYRKAYQLQKEATLLRQSVDSEQVKQSLAIERFQSEEARLRAERQLAHRENELLKASEHKLKIVNEFARELAATYDTQQLGQRVYQLMQKYFDSHIISFATHDVETGSATFRVVIENGGFLPVYCLPRGLNNSRTLDAIRIGKPLNFSESDPVIHAGDPELIPRSQLYLPLLLENSVVGVFSCQSVEADRYQGDDLELILAIAPFLTLAIENARSHELAFELNRQLHEEKSSIERAQSQIEHLANHDMLTDLPNRRALDERLEQLLRKDATASEFAFAYIDLDGFKPINDLHGHAVGDSVLKVISQRIRNVLRKTDFAARIGGDEFVLLLFRENDMVDDQSLIQRVLDSIEQPISIDGELVSVSASIGVVISKRAQYSATELMLFSDQAMYEAKRSGEGGVRFYSPPSQ